MTPVLREGFVAEWRPDEQQVRAILGGLDEALLVYELGGTLRYVNTAALDTKFSYLYLGAAKPSVQLELRTLDNELIAPDQAPLERALRTESFSNFEVRVRDLATGQRWLHRCSGWMVQQDSLLCVLKGEDITGHREAEERFETCFCESPLPTMLISLKDLEVVNVNNSFSELTGLEPNEVEGRSFDKLELFANAEAREQTVERVLATKEDTLETAEFELRTKKGDRTQVVFASHPITLHGENALLATLTDVTERRRTEEQLMQAIQEVMQDTAWFSRSVIERLAQIRSSTPETPAMVSLTKRERQLLELVAAGYSNAQLVEELGLAKNTVRNYVARIYEKLDVHSRAEAVVWARERGIVAR